MCSQTSDPDQSKQKDDFGDLKTVEEKELDRIADEAAERAEKTEQRYDSEHDIFTK